MPCTKGVSFLCGCHDKTLYKTTQQSKDLLGLTAEQFIMTGNAGQQEHQAGGRAMLADLSRETEEITKPRKTKKKG